MKKSVSIVYGVLLVIGFILMALSFAFAGKKNTSFAEDSRPIELQPDRVVEVGEDVREYYFDSNQMQSEFSELTFFSVHQCVEVYADGEQIYSLEKSSTVFGRTPGTGWNTIQLQEGVKSFSVRIEAVYPAVRDHVTRFYQENDGQMVYQTMRGSVPEIMVSTVDGAIGIMLLIYYAIARRKVKMGPGILYFGIFTLMMGMWSMNEAELVAYMVKSRTAASYTGYMMIMLMIAPFAAFLQEFSEVEEKYISNIICICSFANAIVCTVLHMTGICEFKNTVFCTHFLMACDLLYLLYVIWQRYRVRGMVRRVCVCIWGLVILLLSYAVDMSAYYIGWRRTDVIGRVGFLRVICLHSIEKCHRHRRACRNAVLPHHRFRKAAAQFPVNGTHAVAAAVFPHTQKFLRLRGGLHHCIFAGLQRRCTCRRLWHFRQGSHRKGGGNDIVRLHWYRQLVLLQAAVPTFRCGDNTAGV